MRTKTLLLVALFALLCVAVNASSIDGLYMHHRSSIIVPKANAYRSRRTLMPFNYYSINVCRPSEQKMKEEKAKADIGEILMGNRLVTTPYEFNVSNDIKCQVLCEVKFTKRDVRRANYMIENGYDVRMFLDDVPLVSTKENGSGGATYRKGYPFGLRRTTSDSKPVQHAIYNHLDFTIRYTHDQLFGYRIVGFHVTPHSYDKVDVCSDREEMQMSDRMMTLPPTKKFQEVTVRYTYSVKWEDSEYEYVIEHSIQSSTQKRGHKIAAMYGVLLTVLIGVVVAFVMLRTVRKDLAVYLDEELHDEQLREESGWKLVRGDVFRPPPQAVLFSTLIGAGCQVATTMFVTMVLCATGAVNPSVRGHFLTAVLFVFLFAHIVSGFATSRLLKLFGMHSWKTAMLCMTAFPLALGGGILTLNFLHWAKHTTVAIPFGTVLVMALVWMLVSLPFGAAGVFFGYSMDTIAIMTKVSSIPRLIPAEAGSKTIYYAIFGSFVPLVACWIEMSYVLNAFWREEQIYMFGLITFFFCTVAVLCFEVGIVVTYFTLRDEDYRWWWRSFLTLAMTGVYTFCYSIFFLKRFLQIRLIASIILFLAYMLGVSVMFSLALGTISFLGSLWLVQRMYGAIKAD